MRKMMLFAFFLAGCGRVVLPQSVDVEPPPCAEVDAGHLDLDAVDLSPAPDMMCWNDDSSPLCYPVRHPCVAYPDPRCMVGPGELGCDEMHCRI